MNYYYFTMAILSVIVILSNALEAFMHQKNKEVKYDADRYYQT